MAGIGRARITGSDRHNLFRGLDRTTKVLQSILVHDPSMLPPAREYPGRVMYVGGTVLTLYYSNGTIWFPITVPSITSDDGTADQTFNSGAGFTAVTGISITIDSFSTLSEFQIVGILPFQAAAGAGSANLRIKNGSSVLHESAMSFTNNEFGTLACMATQTGLSGSQTWTMEASATTTNHTVSSSSTSRKARLIITEIRK